MIISITIIIIARYHKIRPHYHKIDFRNVSMCALGILGPSSDSMLCMMKELSTIITNSNHQENNEHCSEAHVLCIL